MGKCAAVGETVSNLMSFNDASYDNIGLNICLRRETKFTIIYPLAFAKSVCYSALTVIPAVCNREKSHVHK